jgi:Fic family protein
LNEGDLPVPMIAAIAHYQFATIHPYYDSNGSTARLLTNLVLHKSGYGLKGIYSLEEYYARNLQAYYQALSVGESHNYYFGRVESDITGWVAYFCGGMADSFATIRLQASEKSKGEQIDHSHLLRELDQRQKQVLSLFSKNRYATTLEISKLLGVHKRTALNLCKKWYEEGFIIQHGQANKSRKYELATRWLKLL